MRVPYYGVALILSGASGTGKSTVCEKLRAERPNIRFSVSCTTRKPRGEEVDGVHYYFLTEAAFKAKLEAGEFLEYAEVHDHFYGTLKSEVLQYVEQGEDVLLDIDVQGAQKIRETAQTSLILDSCVVSAFIAPPSFEELERRLRGRGTDSEATIQRRLSNAQTELQQWKAYDYLFVNEDSQVCSTQLLELLDTLHHGSKRIKEPAFL